MFKLFLLLLNIGLMFLAVKTEKIDEYILSVFLIVIISFIYYLVRYQMYGTPFPKETGLNFIEKLYGKWAVKIHGWLIVIVLSAGFMFSLLNYVMKNNLFI